MSLFISPAVRYAAESSFQIIEHKAAGKTAETALKEVYLPAFEACIKKSAWATAKVVLEKIFIVIEEIKGAESKHLYDLVDLAIHGIPPCPRKIDFCLFLKAHPYKTKPVLIEGGRPTTPYSAMPSFHGAPTVHTAGLLSCGGGGYAAATPTHASPAHVTAGASSFIPDPAGFAARYSPPGGDGYGSGSEEEQGAVLRRKKALRVTVVRPPAATAAAGAGAAAGARRG